jgi:hypothetical protein
VVHTDPISIVEELLSVAIPVYSLEPQASTGEAVAPLLHPMPSRVTRTESEVREPLRDALGMPGLDGLLEGAAEARRQELVAEREKIQRPVRSGRPDRSSSQPAGWLEGIDDLAPGSFDLLTVTLLFPI